MTLTEILPAVLQFSSPEKFKLIRLLLIATCLLSAGLARAAIVQGRVVDSAGQPVPDAEIRIWRKSRPGKFPIGENEPLKLDTPIHTDAAGQYTTPDIGDAGQAIRVVATATGMVAARTAWVLSDPATINVPDLVPRRMRAVAGRVIDRQGQGVPAASVFHSGDAHQRVETTTDADGRFRLEGVPEGLAPLFAEKAGYLFTGLLPNDGEIAITLAKGNEEPAPLAGGDPWMAETDRVAMGQGLLDPYFDAVVERGGDRDKYWTLWALGYLDPVEALQRLPRCTFADKMWREMARGGILSEWIDRKPADGWDEIRGMIETSEDQLWVATSYLGGAKAMSSGDRPAALEWINQAVLHARQSGAPALRTLCLARAAALLESLDEAERAAKLTAEARSTAPQSLGQEEFASFALSDLAVALALSDLPSALEYLDKLGKGSPYLKACSQVAIRLAATKPAEAENVWRRAIGRERSQPGATYWRDNEAPMFCFRLAGADRAIAERVAAEIADAAWRVRARGAIALALAESDVSEARRFLRLAIDDDGFAKGSFTESPQGRDTAAATMAWLLPVAVQVDPIATGEVFWRSIALRSPAPTTEYLEEEVEVGHAVLAQMLARYDSSIARRLLSPVAARINDWTGPAEAYRQKAMHVIGAAAIIDPRWAADLVEAMPDPPDVSFRHPKNESRRLLVRVLGMNEAKIWTFAGYWQPE